MIPSRRVLEMRSRVLQSLRRFFFDRGFIEVETPVRVKTPALEEFINAEPSGECFLRTSPELHMKRLLCAGQTRIFQIGPCFRKGEKGRLHNPEYTMLEWYRAGCNYMDVLVDTKAMMDQVCRDIFGRTGFDYLGHRVEMMPVWDCFQVRDIFLERAGWDPTRSFDQDRFEIDLVEKIEPAFSVERPTILKDYPVEAAALAMTRENPYRHAERWELYVAGMEMANAFSELTDAEEQRRRFEKCAAARKVTGRTVYDIDEHFLAAMNAGMPESAGVALGVDRLVMLLANCAEIKEVISFSDD